VSEIGQSRNPRVQFFFYAYATANSNRIRTQRLQRVQTLKSEIEQMEGYRKRFIDDHKRLMRVSDQDLKRKKQALALILAKLKRSNK
jgi:hypothetical protein